MFDLYDFCAGIGGFSLAGHHLGWETKLFCEIHPFLQKLLKQNFPNVPVHGDIVNLTDDEFRKLCPNYRPFRSVFSAGWPCQPFSIAGERGGDTDDRFLWEEIFRLIKSLRPSWFVGENVPGILSMVESDCRIEVEGQTTTISQDYTDEVLRIRQNFIVERVCSDLESIGYEVQTFTIPAVATNALHRRDRVLFVANLHKVRREVWDATGDNPAESYGREQEKWCKDWAGHEVGTQTASPYYSKERVQGYSSLPFLEVGRFSWGQDVRSVEEVLVRSNIPEPIFCGASDGVPNWVDRIASCGNTVVPQVIYQFFRFIELATKEHYAIH